MVAVLFTLVATVMTSPADTVVAGDPPGPVTASRALGHGSITIDGRLDEAIWQGPAAVTSFTQSSPNEGAPATERGEVRFAVDDGAVYVAARLHDAAPDSIIAQLSRRDNTEQSDFFTVYFDPYRDGRTGYQFLVTAAGVQVDGTLSNDTRSDHSWDGVWESAVQRDGGGWTVELRIPISQLRIHDGGQDVWGVNVGRGIGRRGEVSFLVPRLSQESGFVSRFAELRGLEQLRPRRRMELLPYLTGRAAFEGGTAGNPFNDGSLSSQSIGGDLRLGLGGAMQLNATINPDFGQVEVDPAVVNLSDVETFFEERRPFFVEGSSTFDFGFGGADNFMGFNWVNNQPFYSRRIGRAPQGRLPAADFVDAPRGTRILGAAKVTGRLGAWNLGALGGATERTHAGVSIGGLQQRAEVAPFTGFGVVRMQRDIAGGRHGIGVLGTWTGRDFDDPALVDQLNARATVVGLDGWVTLDQDRDWVLSAWGTLSNVHGSADRIADLQRGPVHYFQRPDAEHVAFDPTRTSLTGMLGRVSINRQTGNTLFNAAVGAVTPGYDNNDLGFVGQADLINAHVASGYRWTQPGSWYQNARVQGAVFGRWDFDGNRTGSGFWNNSQVTLRNFNVLSVGLFTQPTRTDTRSTRGGPRMRIPGYVNLSAGYSTDGRKDLVAGFEWSGYWSGGGSGNGWSFAPTLSWRPASNVQLSFGPQVNSDEDGNQYLRTVEDETATATYGRRYVFGHLQRKTLSANLRVNWIFSPRLSLELFAQPLIASGDYDEIRQLRTPDSYDLLDYGTEGTSYDAATGLVDPDGEGPAPSFGIGQPDFTFASLRGNAVLRWEWAAGSTIFLVWTQDRAYADGTGAFEPRRAMDQLLSAPGRNVLAVKATWWLGR
jgi:hypothetical protein